MAEAVEDLRGLVADPRLEGALRQRKRFAWAAGESARRGGVEELRVTFRWRLKGRGHQCSA